MPIVKVLHGLFRVICTDYSGNVVKRFERSFYGETIGETLDNIVKTPELLQDEIDEWIFMFKDHDYHLLDDNWKLIVLVPSFNEDDEKTTSIPISNIRDLQSFANSLRIVCVEKELEKKKSTLPKREISKFSELIEHHTSRDYDARRKSEGDTRIDILGSTLDTIFQEWDQAHSESFFSKFFKKF